MYLVGVTGGIAMGKSQVTSFFQKLNVPVLDADLIARQIVEPGEEAWHQIYKHFGSDIFNEDSTLNRTKLGQIIFDDPAKRKLLNSITHPQIYRKMICQIVWYFLSGYQFVLMDLPLLFETKKWISFLDEIIVVKCDDDQQLSRLMSRNNFTEEEAQKRINSQMPISEKTDRATIVIDNKHDLASLERDVSEVYSVLRSRQYHWRNRALLLVFIASSCVFLWGGVTYILNMLF